MSQMCVVSVRSAKPSNPRRTVPVRRARILIADDETSVRDYLDQVLRSAGYVTARAIDGQDALEMAEQLGPFDMLITDELMPRMLGHELARQLRKQDPALKVLYVTAYTDRLLEEKLTSWEHEVLLGKPATPDEILDAVSRLLRLDAA